MNTMGCSFLILAATALVVGFIPILNWITLFIAMPLSVLGILAAGNAMLKPSRQSADKTIFWIAVALGGMIVLRLIFLA